MKLLWSVDVHESHPKAVEAAIRFLDALHERVPLAVHAVTVQVAPENPVPPSLKREIVAKLTKRLGKCSKKKWLRDQHVIFETQVAQRVAVLDVVDYATEGGFDAIMVIKHSKKDRQPAFLGSFAEMLAFISPLPLFLVNPDGDRPSRIRDVLVSTDAGARCAKEFDALSKLVPLDGASLEIFHRIPVAFSSYMSYEDQKRYAGTEATKALGRLSRLRDKATQLDAKARLEIVQRSGTTEDSIMSRAKRAKSDLIVLNHRGKGAVGFFLGRVTRRVLQEADRPVLLLRS